MPALVERLRKLDTCSVSDALDKLGLPGAVTGLVPFTVRGRVATPAVTVKLGAPKRACPSATWEPAR
jgi:regulator of RNase E activity RraA